MSLGENVDTSGFRDDGGLGVGDIADSMEILYALKPGDSAEGGVGERMARRS